MDDTMMDLLADDRNLRRRLEAYAESRLSPDLAASARIRARVLAIAHRQSASARADATLALLPEPVQQPSATVGRASARHLGSLRDRPWRRTASVLLAASLGLGAVASTGLAARPGGALYGARIWAETLTLPNDPSARAVAELQRLTDRLAEASSANAAGDTAGASAALRAYESIVSEATANAVAADDDVATAALETGVGQNVTVLQALLGTVPEQAGQAIKQVIERAIERSNDAIDTIHGATPPNGGGSDNGDNGDNASQPTATPTPKPTREPKSTATPGPAPATTPHPTSTSKPTKEPKPTATPGPAPATTPHPTPDPDDPPGPKPDGGQSQGQGG